MRSCNRVILTGRIGRAPKRRYRPDGSPVIEFSLELNEEDRSGHSSCHTRQPPGRGNMEQKGRNLISIVAMGKLAEFDLDLLQTGQPLFVEGRLHQRHWQTPEGRSRTQTEVIATDFRTMDENEHLGNGVPRPSPALPERGQAQARKSREERRSPFKNERRKE